ncbi:MAG: hypothetical protein JW904_08400 [Spirochaetales bacterium]|nr:hypothetical protein [Spirochaetales bacterium]
MPENDSKNPEQRNNRNNRRNRFRDRRRGDRSRRKRVEGSSNNSNLPLLKCAVCDREIRDLSSAICQKGTGQPIHFDCIIKNISETETISSHERVCYLGKGSFGIVRFQRMGGIIPFVIRKRIQYEEFEDTPEWRKELNKYRAAHPLYKAKEAESTE